MKKHISMGIAVACALAMTSVAYARYSVISSFSTTADISSTSVSADASVRFNESTDATLKLSLERSSNNGASYSKYRTLDTQSGKGYTLAADGRASGLSSAYDYRVKAEVFVYDEDGNQIEYDFIYKY